MEAQTTTVREHPPAARIATGLVQLTARSCGRGPTQARTTITPELVPVVLRGILTRAEQSLVAAGGHAHVRDHRARLHRLMEGEAVALVEAETGRRASAHLVDACPLAGVAVHTVLLRPRLELA